jgi:hypothetical protein
MEHAKPDFVFDPDTRSVQEALAFLDWSEAFDVAWEWCENQSSCDSMFGREYWRVKSEAWSNKLPASQAGLRCFIRYRANIGPVESITALSLAVRESKRLAQQEGK